MSRPTADVSVVICAYTETRWNELNRAIASLRHQTVLPQELVLVIDHNPQLLTRVRDQITADPITELSVSLIENGQARGLSGARNSGVAQAQAPWVAFLDEDAAAAMDWLECLDVAGREARVMGVGGAIEPRWQAGRPAWFPDEFDWVVGCTYRGMPHRAQPVRNLIGCNMAFRRRVFDEVGGFRDGMGRIGTLPLGCEETEFCIRLRQHCEDAILLYEPRARVLHSVPHQRGQWNYFSSRCYAEGISKAQVERFVGADAALATERNYATRTLPQGIWRNMHAVWRERDASGLLRAGAMMAGLGMTTAGYIRGKCASFS